MREYNIIAFAGSLGALLGAVLLLSVFTRGVRRYGHVRRGGNTTAPGSSPGAVHSRGVLRDVLRESMPRHARPKVLRAGSSRAAGHTHELFTGHRTS